MLFNTVSYFVFFFAVVAAFYLSPAAWKKPVLLVASYFFYGSWNWKFIPLLLSLTAIDYCAAIWIEQRKGRVRKFALLLGVGANLAFLGFFKYFSFAADNLATRLHIPTQSFWHDIVLPLGISFHTFQSISYIVDVYRGTQPAIRKPLDYALFIAFFPQLVAGPIVRARDFFADLYAWQSPEHSDMKQGAFLIVLGLTKKVVLADNLAPIADRYFGTLKTRPVTSGVEAWGAVFAFALQIYFDFAGYTDMAIGFARVLGFHFPVNFRRPYLAGSITDFWRRWHISLSSWLRDYLYIPLGGNREGRVKTYRNLMLTMCLGGLWHGANWTFILWGGYHGALLSCERMVGIGRQRSFTFTSVPRVLFTFVLVCVGWVFFRARSLHEALTLLVVLVKFPRGHWPIEPALMVLIAGSLVVTLWAERIDILAMVGRRPLWQMSMVMGALLFLVELFAPSTPLPFVYFQF